MSPENKQGDPIFQGFGGRPSLPPTDPRKKDEETPWSVSFQLDKLLAPFPSHALDLSPYPCPSSSKPSDSDVGTISDTIEQSITLQDRSYCHDDSTDSGKEDDLHVNGKGAVAEKYGDADWTREAVVADTEGSASPSQVSKDVCNQTEREMLSCGLHELPTRNEPEESPKVVHAEVNVSESESPRGDGIPEARSNAEVKTKDEGDSLDLVFQTSVDGSEGENGDVDAFFQQVDTEGLVYWAEPIHVCNVNPLLEGSDGSEASEESSGNYLLPEGPADPFPSAERATSSSSTSPAIKKCLNNASTASSNTPSRLATPDFKSSSRSVSVQMSSSLSSHIVHRKDIPYRTNSKCTHLPSVLPLDTSTPFRAVQSWTDLHIHRNALEAVPHPRPKLAQDCVPGMSGADRAVSVDKGLWPSEEVSRSGNEDGDTFWEGNQTAATARYCTDHQCACRNKQRTLGNFYVSNTTLSVGCPCFSFKSFFKTP